eukprot:CAMPEP_0171104470 /NCGR_PEP_ID=MMETSP0766_2-20121228/60710_1 /TAXON_ID=439317 /ORGANISM="Gambierdiscus australes, Strain CAWD 149" /LENGTH=62 /DNA_ID=CAMNT_0011565107 /DNA_START=23 /DNA_END=208 /DNA_ORIENTATION=+
MCPAPASADAVALRCCTGTIRGPLIAVVESSHKHRRATTLAHKGTAPPSPPVAGWLNVCGGE